MSKRLELSAIFLTAALLFVSAINLLTRSVGASMSDAFPELYAPGVAAEYERGEKTLYLTFDDGPSKNTEKLLDLLTERGAKATFFVTAQEEDTAYRDSLLRRIVQEGHTLGLHSYTHAFSKIYASPESYLKDIDRLREMVVEATGYEPSVVRFPGGSHTMNASAATISALKAELERRGYRIYDWDILTSDSGASPRAAAEITRAIVQGVEKHDGGIVLCHDNRTPTTTPRAVAEAIDRLAPKGYAFEALLVSRVE